MDYLRTHVAHSRIVAPEETAGTTEGAAAHVAAEGVTPEDDAAIVSWFGDPEQPKVLHDAKGPMLALAARGCLYCYLTGFDPEFAAISPGTLLLGHAIEQAMRDGARTCDLLRGRERYKYLWGGRDRPTFARTLRPLPAPRAAVR